MLLTIQLHQKTVQQRSLQNFEFKPVNKLLIERDSWFLGGGCILVKFDAVSLKITKVGHKLNGWSNNSQNRKY